MSAPPIVRRSPVAARHCNLARGFELIGDRWTLLILRSALYGVRRFDDLQADLDIPRSVLSNRLAGLVESGLMAKRKFREKGQRTRVEYPLTKTGTRLGLPFFAMTEWSDRWIGDGGSPSTLRSTANGQRLRVALADSAAGASSQPRSRSSSTRNSGGADAESNHGLPDIGG
jgi:DNA-binding HxlR family transcriptional regulator